ncbi:ZMYM1 protein, partial [Polyodon spathula]|nr:ZMYM1 protein [Polyodon spathula]
LIGKHRLSCRGNESEAAYTLEDSSVDHGSFLEFVLFLSKYDVCLQENINDCIEKSKMLHFSGQGRGLLITLLSKTTVNTVIDTMIASEVREAGMFSGQIDTTQDITSKDQCSVIVRYVTDCIHEKLLVLDDCKSSDGKYLLHLLMWVLNSCKIEIRKCIGNSTDGAANMQGQYKGFSAWLSTESPDQIHVWCYAHVLSLVLADTTKVNLSQDSHHRRLTVTLARIQENLGSKPEERVKAKAYTQSLLKYETVLTAQIFLRILKLTAPLSKYLQTSGMDILIDHHMVSGAQGELKKCVRDFDVKKTADHFVDWANDKLQELQQTDAITACKIQDHNVIHDTITDSMHCRFLISGTLYADFACLDPLRHKRL